MTLSPCQLSIFDPVRLVGWGPEACLLDRIATHILAFEGDSKVVWHEGNYSEYEADKKARLGAAADPDGER